MLSFLPGSKTELSQVTASMLKAKSTKTVCIMDLLVNKGVNGFIVIWDQIFSLRLVPTSPQRNTKETGTDAQL